MAFGSREEEGDTTAQREGNEETKALMRQENNEDPS